MWLSFFLSFVTFPWVLRVLVKCSVFNKSFHDRAILLQWKWMQLNEHYTTRVLKACLQKGIIKLKSMFSKPWHFSPGWILLVPNLSLLKYFDTKLPRHKSSKIEGSGPPLMRHSQLYRSTVRIVFTSPLQSKRKPFTQDVIWKGYMFRVIYSLSFFLSWVSKTQPNHWTKRMANTRLATWDPRTCPGPDDRSIT